MASIRELMTHPGLSKIFQEEIIFENIPARDCVALLAEELERFGFSSEGNFLNNLRSPDYAEAEKLFSDMQLTPSWSNARDMKHLTKQMIGTLLEEETNIDKQTRALFTAHIKTYIRQMVTLQKNRCSSKKGPSTDSLDNLALSSASHTAPSWRKLWSKAVADKKQPSPPLQYMPQAETGNSASKRIKLNSNDRGVTTQKVSWKPEDYRVHMETASPGRKIDEHNQNAKHPAI